MLAGATGSVHLQPDPQMVGPNVARIEQAAEQGVAGSFHRVERAGAIERISESFALHCGGAATAILNVDPTVRFASREDPPGNDLEPPLADKSRDGCADLRRNAVPVHVPPWPRVAQEASLLVCVEALPQRMAVRAQTVDRCPPTDLGATTPQPAPKRAHATRRDVG
jgi:hypothetical protein